MSLDKHRVSKAFHIYFSDENINTEINRKTREACYFLFAT